MRNLAFVIWMLGFPLVSALAERLDPSLYPPTTPDEVAVAAIVWGFIWAVVGGALFEVRRAR